MQSARLTRGCGRHSAGSTRYGVIALGCGSSIAGPCGISPIGPRRRSAYSVEPALFIATAASLRRAASEREISTMTDPALNITVKQQAKNMADGLGITVFITQNGRIVQQRPASGGTEVRPYASAKPTPHGTPAEIRPSGDGT